MTKLADYIERIEINSLWSGHKHIVWELNPSVNVLSGKNGAGKSTILNRMVQHLREMPASGELGDHEGMGDFTPPMPQAFATTCCAASTAKWW